MKKRGWRGEVIGQAPAPWSWYIFRNSNMVTKKI